MRITAERLADGRVELGLEQLGADGAWGEAQPPENRFLAADAEVGAALRTDPIALEVAVEFDLQTREERAASEYQAYLFETGAGRRPATGSSCLIRI